MLIEGGVSSRGGITQKRSVLALPLLLVFLFFSLLATTADDVGTGNGSVTAAEAHTHRHGVLSCFRRLLKLL